MQLFWLYLWSVLKFILYFFIVCHLLEIYFYCFIIILVPYCTNFKYFFDHIWCWLYYSLLVHMWIIVIDSSKCLIFFFLIYSNHHLVKSRNIYFIVFFQSNIHSFKLCFSHFYSQRTSSYSYLWLLFCIY